ncbi:tetratricopeptide repeat protein [Natroniella sulfidigena]|uniref:tetratricopeptide repeat protein n=1 Tax=Natroniella sulfidigena TaxID=723921 RepID=UPI00200A3FF1|nr:tetratricopeptide repeat protein [Natroniella sulfidigena]MCK8817875.1 tetratricopeptide repeat protein [Natroniella sulfidigena]
MKKQIIFCLIFVLIFSTTAPALASNSNNDNGSSDSDTAIKVGSALVVVGGLFYFGRRYYRRSKAGDLYDEAQAYASRGEWGQAVEAYEAALEYVDDYEDTKVRLEKARVEAEAMYVELGDEAKEAEQFEEARKYYQLALKYHPTAFRAQNRLDEMEQDLVAVHYRRGHSFEVQGNWEEAYLEYQEAYNVDPNYQDLADRYHRAQAKVEGDIPLRALIFVLNRTGQSGLERTFINALQSRLEAKITDEFYMIDRKNVQQIMDEQGQALSDNRDRTLGLDIANLVGAQEIIMGQLTDLDASSDQVTLEFELEIIDVEDNSVLEEIEYEYEFAEGIGSNEITRYMDRLAEKLVEEF